MGRSPCCDKNGLKKGPWTPEEDQRLIQYIQQHGPGNWRALPKNAGLQRCGKSCRLRWTNYLRPDIKRGRFSFEEEETIIQLHSILGNKWSAIAGRLPGRTDNEIKNYWNTHIRKRLLRMGIDPVTHSPRLDLLDLSSILTSAHQLNLSNLLGLQTLVNNPQMLRLATTLLTSPSNHDENPDMILQKLQQNNQMFNTTTTTTQALHNNQTSMFQPDPHHDQFQTVLPINEVPPCSTAPFLNQTQLMQADPGINLNCQDFQENLAPSDSLNNVGFVTPPADYSYCTSDHQIGPDPLDKLGLPSMNTQDFSFDSVLSTPLSSLTPLNSSSTFINSGTEDERESYCSSMLKFEIPESLYFNDFM